LARDKEPALNALLGRGAYYSGDLSFEGRVRLDGHFEGRIYTDDLLEIGELGLLEGEIDAAFVRVAGRVDGKLRVRQRLTLESSGRIYGEIDARELEVRPGATLRATVVSGRGDAE
jgi:cytoskeletal protein CcmA (bactofilin family)